MRRRLFNLAAALSVALLIATAVSWSVVAYDPIYCYSKDFTGPLIVWEHSIVVESGRIGGFFRRNADSRGSTFAPQYSLMPGFRVKWGTSNGTFGAFDLRFPHLLAIWGILPLTWLLNGMAQRLACGRAVGGNRCSVCGYDLRATPDRCPECGKIPGTISN